MACGSCNRVDNTNRLHKHQPLLHNQTIRGSILPHTWDWLGEPELILPEHFPALIINSVEGTVVSGSIGANLTYVKARGWSFLLKELRSCGCGVCLAGPLGCGALVPYLPCAC